MHRRRHRREKEWKERMVLPVLREPPFRSLDVLTYASLMESCTLLCAANPSEIVRKAAELTGCFTAVEDAKTVCQKLAPQANYGRLRSFPKLRREPVCCFCRMKGHKTSECRSLADKHCALCGRNGHTSNFCVGNLAWPELKRCCKIVSEQFPHFTHELAFKRAVKTRDFQLFDTLVTNGATELLKAEHCIMVSKLRDREARDRFFGSLIPVLPTEELNAFIGQYLMRKIHQRTDAKFMMLDCLVKGRSAKLPQGFEFKAQSNVVRILQRIIDCHHFQPLPWLLSPLWSIIASFVDTRELFQRQ